MTHNGLLNRGFNISLLSLLDMYSQKLGSQCKQPILANADVKIYFACSQCDDEYIYYDCRVDTTSLLITSAPLVVFHKPGDNLLSLNVVFFLERTDGAVDSQAARQAGSPRSLEAELPDRGPATSFSLKP